MNSFRYKILVETLNKIEREHFWRIKDQDLAGHIHIFENKRVPNEMLRGAGIDKALADLSEDTWIDSSYTMPGAGQVGTVTVKTKSKEIRRYLDKMFQIAERYPYLHRFVYIKTRREPLTGRPSEEELYYIYDDTLLVDEVVGNDPLDTKGGEKRKKVLENALNQIKNQKLRGGEPAIIDVYGNDQDKIIEDIKEDDSEFHMRFLYRNRATKECLMKEGNILEAYVYYSIWKNAFVDDVKLNVAFTWEAGGCIRKGSDHE